MIQDSIDSAAPYRPLRDSRFLRSVDVDFRTSLESDYSDALSPIPTARDDAELPTHTLLDAGTLVCFASLTGELCTLVQAHDGTWALQMLTNSYPDEYAHRPSTIPPASVFMVLRNGSKMGFRSLWAEGRNLQTIKAPTAPPRVNNYNFGSWESWSMINGHLFNCRWIDKVLPLALLPLCVCSVQDLRREERARLQYERGLHTRVDELEHEASRLCGQLREVLTINKQLEHAHTTLERQLADATHTREQQQQQLAEADNAARAATGRCLELEVQLGNVEQEKAHLALALEGERAQYRQHCVQLEEHHKSMQESHALQSQLLTAQLERSTREAATASAQLQHTQQSLHTREEQLRAVQNEVNRLEHALHTAERQLTQLNAAQRHAMQQQRAMLTSPLSRGSPPARGGGHGTPQRSPLMPLSLPQQQVGVMQEGGGVEGYDTKGGMGTPRGRGVPPTPDHVDSSTRTPPAASSGRQDENAPPSMALSAAGLTPMSPALFALLEGEEGAPACEGEIITPRVLPTQDYLRLSSAPGSTMHGTTEAAESTCAAESPMKGGHSPPAAHHKSTRPPQRLWEPPSSRHPSAALAQTPPRGGHHVGVGAYGGGVYGGGHEGMRASVHGYPTPPRAPGNMDEHVDERIRRWVTAEDDSEHTTVADPLDVGEAAASKPWPRTRSSFMARQLPPLESIFG